MLRRIPFIKMRRFTSFSAPEPKTKKQDGNPGLWLAETFLTSSLKPLNWFQRNLTRSKISSSCSKFVLFLADSPSLDLRMNAGPLQEVPPSTRWATHKPTRQPIREIYYTRDQTSFIWVRAARSHDEVKHPHRIPGHSSEARPDGPQTNSDRHAAGAPHRPLSEINWIPGSIQAKAKENHWKHTILYLKQGIG